MRESREDYPLFTDKTVETQNGVVTFLNFPSQKHVRIGPGIQARGPPSPAHAAWVVSPVLWSGWGSWLDEQAGMLWALAWEHPLPLSTPPQPNSREAAGPSCIFPLASHLSFSTPPEFFRKPWEPFGAMRRDLIKLHTLIIQNSYLLTPYGVPKRTAWGSGSAVRQPGFISHVHHVSGYPSFLTYEMGMLGVPAW